MVGLNVVCYRDRVGLGRVAYLGCNFMCCIAGLDLYVSLLHVLLLHVLLLQLSVRCSAAGRAALTMFRVSTGDDWVYIMQQCGVRPPVCTVSVSLLIPFWNHASPLGYALPAACNYDVQLCLVSHSYLVVIDLLYKA